MAEANIEKFDPSKLMDGVRDRIKATFVSLIPDEAWDQMVQTEIDRFTKEERRYGNVNSSGFTLIAQETLKSEAQRKIEEILSNPLEQAKYFNGKAFADYIKDYIDKNAAEIFQSFIVSLVGDSLKGFSESLYSRIMNTARQSGY